MQVSYPAEELFGGRDVANASSSFASRFARDTNAAVDARPDLSLMVILIMRQDFPAAGCARMRPWCG